MRSVGLALLIAWFTACRPVRPAPPPRPGTAVAVAGGDRAAVAWIAHDGRRLQNGWIVGMGELRVSLIDERARVREVFRQAEPPSSIYTTYELAESGNGRFILGMETWDRLSRSRGFQLLSIEESGLEWRRDLKAALSQGPWWIEASGDEIALVEMFCRSAAHGEASCDEYLHLLDEQGAWRADHFTFPPGEVRVGSGGGHVVIYQIDGDKHRVTLSPGRRHPRTYDVPAPECPSEARGFCPVMAVAGLADGYARLVWLPSDVVAIDGSSAGKPFHEAPVTAIARQPGLAIDAAGRFVIYDDRWGHTPLGRLPDNFSDAFRRAVQPDPSYAHLDFEPIGPPPRHFGIPGERWATAIPRGFIFRPTTVEAVVERFPVNGDSALPLPIRLALEPR
jgi:hypothetical protein